MHKKDSYVLRKEKSFDSFLLFPRGTKFTRREKKEETGSEKKSLERRLIL